MKIPSSLSIPSIGATITAAGVSAWAVVLCLLAGVLVALAPHALAHRTERERVRNDDDLRKKICDTATTLPPAQRAKVLCELARGLNPQEGPPPADPAAPSRSP